MEVRYSRVLHLSSRLLSIGLPAGFLVRRLVAQGSGRVVLAGSPVLLPDHLSTILRINIEYEARLTFLLGWQNLGSLQDCLLQVEDCASVEVHIDICSTLRISDPQRSHLQEWFDEIPGETETN